MPAVPVLATLVFCAALSAQKASPNVAAPAIHSDVSASAVSATLSRPEVVPSGVDAALADGGVLTPEPARTHAFSFPEAGMLLLVGSCMVWVGFAKRRNSPPRRVAR